MNQIIPKKQILANILEGSYRKIESVDDKRGLGVRIGVDTVILISWQMLEACFAALKSPTGYDTRFFQKEFPDKYAEHDCYVHVVGQIFVESGLAVQKRRRYFAKPA